MGGKGHLYMYVGMLCNIFILKTPKTPKTPNVEMEPFTTSAFNFLICLYGTLSPLQPSKALNLMHLVVVDVLVVFSTSYRTK